MRVNPEFVAEKLAGSRRAHVLYRQFSPQMKAVPGGHPIMDLGSPSEARRALLDAQDLRQQAHDADPDHLSPAWADDIAPHAELMAYYASTLGD